MADYRSSSTPPAPAGPGVPQELPLLTPAFSPQVEIRPSTRRRKTASASYEGDKIVVLVPARLPITDRQDLANRLVERLLRRGARSFASDEALASRAELLGDRHLGGVRARSIRWSANQSRRWGSCTPSTRDIRISSRLQVVPDWVLDSVIVHELAHLLEASHSARFHALISRFPRLAEADAYLLGYSLGVTSATWVSPGEAQAAGDTNADCVEGQWPTDDTLESLGASNGGKD